jgi:pyruvate/2-oxoglutarate/acetoin dehydrogenase E1 component
MGADIAARIADEAFDHLDGPVRRVTAKDSFVPFAPSLESYVLPSQDQVTSAIRELAAW